MTYKLHYFNGRGRAEVIRLALVAGGQKFEDIRIEMETWHKIKLTTPTGVLPYLETPDGILVQSNAILRHLARKFHLYGKTECEHYFVDRAIDQVSDIVALLHALMFGPTDKRDALKKKEFVEEKGKNLVTSLVKFLDDNKTGFVAGNATTVGDLAVMDLTYTLHDVAPDLMKHFHSLDVHYKHILEVSPAVKKWINERPKTPF